jgi:hypothetical protein
MADAAVRIKVGYVEERGILDKERLLSGPENHKGSNVPISIIFAD